MLLIVFTVGRERYGLDSRQVREVVPCVRLRPLARAPGYVAGLFDYRGCLVPVLDLSALMGGDPVPLRYSSRVLLVAYPRADAPLPETLGLVAEQVIEAVHVDETAFSQAPVSVAEAPYLGDLAMDNQGMIQRVDVDKLLTDDVRQTLFKRRAEAQWAG